MPKRVTRNDSFLNVELCGGFFFKSCSCTPHGRVFPTVSSLKYLLRGHN